MQELRRYEAEQNEQRSGFATALGVLPGISYPPTPSSSAASANDASLSLSGALPTLIPLGTYESARTASSVTTSVSGPIPLQAVRDLRDRDKILCEKYMSNAVVATALSPLLSSVGGPEMVAAFDASKAKSEAVKNNTSYFEKLRMRVIQCYTAEGESKSQGEKTEVEGMYWMSALASMAVCESRKAPFEYRPSPTRSLPQTTVYKKVRKYDATLLPVVSSQPEIGNILLNIEFTRTAAPLPSAHPLLGGSGQTKLQQAVANADDLLRVQATRTSVFTLSFHGKGDETVLFVTSLGRERLDLCRIERCFSEAVLTTTAALLGTLATSSYYQLGFSPLFSYFFSSAEAGAALIPTTLHLPDITVDIAVNTASLSPPPSRPFSRATLILRGSLCNSEKTPVVIKIASIDTRRTWRERDIITLVFGSEDQPDPGYTPQLLHSFVSSQATPSAVTTNISLTPPPHRRLELYVFASSGDGQPLHRIAFFRVFCHVTRQLFDAIADYSGRGAIHGDISPSNALWTPEGQLELIDWECGAKTTLLSPAPNHVMGTLDTMSINTLEGGRPTPLDDAESACYVAFKVLCHRFDPPAHLRPRWQMALAALKWGEAGVSIVDLINSRDGFWLSQSDIREGKQTNATRVAAVMRSGGHEGSARLIEGIFCLPIHRERRALMAWIGESGEARAEEDIQKKVNESLIRIVEQAKTCLRESEGLGW